MTTTDIATRNSTTLATWNVPEPEPRRGVDLEQWVTTAQQVANVADMLSKTSFVPKAFQGRPAECAAAILAGQECGFEPMASLRAIDVIQGKPALSALAQRAVVQGHGHEMVVVESTETRAIVKGRRKGDVEWQTSTWNTDRARKLQLLGKDNWKNQPQAMLVARATAECARLVAADALLGMPYSAEELRDQDDTAGIATTPEPATAAKKPAKRTAQRAPLPPAPEPDPAPEPELDDTAAETETPATEQPEGPHTISPSQSKMLHALLRQAGRSDKDEALVYIAGVVNRPIESTKELSRDEASRVIDDLQATPADAGTGEA